MTYSASLADPNGSQALVAAVTWLQTTLLGTVATTIAVIGVASIGFRMLTGHLDVRRGATIVVGCFILLGASSIAAGLGSLAYEPALSLPAVSPAIPPPAIPVEAPRSHDPYAGATID